MSRIKGSSILVTGGAGFIGSHLVDRLLQCSPREVRILDNLNNGTLENNEKALRDARVCFIPDGDLCNPASVEEGLRDVDLVFHLAAVKHGVTRGNEKQLFDTNIRGTFDLLHAASQRGVKKIVFASSLYVYGTDRPGPYRETECPKANTLYGASKLSGEYLVRAFSTQTSIEYAILRYFFVYGPRLYQLSYQNALFSRTLRRLSRGLSPVIYGDGEQVLDYIFIDDAVEATVLAMEYKPPDLLSNVGTGQGATVNQVVQMLTRLSCSEARPEHQPPDESAGTVRVADCQRLKTELGFAPTVTLEDGLKRVMDWWEEHGSR